ncbi:helix-turn-helix domain-containing protein [Streptomyces sp. BI20]|uniref:helix-turn-helix domain-containing protein n=1 Tax=Streptomyces sp. BI20 TaxID=3403460 RepID=UPI003C770FCA
MKRDFFPHPALHGLVDTYSAFAYTARTPRTQWIAPTTTAALSFGFGGAVRTESATNARPGVSAPSRAALPLTGALIGRHEGRIRGITLRLGPIGAYALFGVPMHLWDVPWLDPVDLLPARSRELVERLGAAAGPEEQARLLDAALLPLVERGPRISPEVVRVWHELHRTRGRRPVRELAAEVGWSVRHLERLFRVHVGRSPAAIARTLRFGTALRAWRTGHSLARAALLAGYGDQAHFNHACKAMTGLSPTRLPADLLDWHPGPRPHTRLALR